jgi:ABC-type transporter Mla subunit MlaD
MERVEHEIHRRRLSRNVGLGLVLGIFVAVVFGLTVVKIGETGVTEGYDHVTSPGLGVPAR